MLVYHFLFGLRASYDTARAGDTGETDAPPSLKNAKEDCFDTVETNNSIQK